jgi:hypothetical protein
MAEGVPWPEPADLDRSMREIERRVRQRLLAYARIRTRQGGFERNGRRSRS